MGATCQFHVQLSIHLQALIQGGVFDRFPGAKIIVGHLGENLVALYEGICLLMWIARTYLASGSTCQELGENAGCTNEKDL
jgi:predicted TIM-barrel fold metal-dependent hydrolase